MTYKVYMIADAEEDILELYHFVSVHDSPAKAEQLLNKIETSCSGLSRLPHRGHTPPELEHIGVYEYKEIPYKPYRIIYQIIDTDVFIHCIFNGRRDLQDVLEKRLLR